MSGRVYGFTHTAVVRAHTHTSAWVKKRTHGEGTENSSDANMCSLFCQRDKTRTIKNLIRIKQINTAALHSIVDTHRHTSYTHAITRFLITQTVYG